jgi:hypothetical protein
MGADERVDAKEQLARLRRLSVADMDERVHRVRERVEHETARSSQG